ncbi:hypothetical protein D4T62_10545 [Salmonella enterica subsp. enterica]|nr:hypothetical protein [Salmonella enterica subsp. enterica]EDR3673577.1 hypothetical protein [Salmonella enterica subsp. arizonae serovar 40:z4,z24:]
MVSKNSEARKCANTNRASIENNRRGNIDMNSVQNNELTFHNVTFNPVMHEQKVWLTSAELASALQYSNIRAVSGLYNRHKDEFTDSMSLVLKMNTKGFGGGNSEKDVRVFSLRGAHLVAMLSNTPVAKEFRRWVLDILDQEAKQQNVAPMFSGRVLLSFEQGELVMARVARDDEHLVSAKTTIELFKQRGYVLASKDEITSKVSDALRGL